MRRLVSHVPRRCELQARVSHGQVAAHLGVRDAGAEDSEHQVEKLARQLLQRHHGE